MVKIVQKVKIQGTVCILSEATKVGLISIPRALIGARGQRAKNKFKLEILKHDRILRSSNTQIFIGVELCQKSKVYILGQ